LNGWDIMRRIRRVSACVACRNFFKEQKWTKWSRKEAIMFGWLKQALRALFRRRELENEHDEELRALLEREIEQNLRPGTSQVEARQVALKEFGSIEQAREEFRDARGALMIEEFWQDLRHGLRVLRKSPVFCFTAILTLAVGIGANTAVFTLLHGLFLRGLPVPRPAELARINMIGPLPGSENAEAGVPWRMYQQLLLRQRSFADLSAWVVGRVNIRDGEGVLRMYNAVLPTGNAFEVLGVKPYLGRLLDSSDDIRGGPPMGWTAVLSHSFSRRALFSAHLPSYL